MLFMAAQATGGVNIYVMVTTRKIAAASFVGMPVAIPLMEVSGKVALAIKLDGKGRGPP